MMFFLLLVHLDRVDEVYVHFMIAGHTKFSCDTMFGTVAKWLRGNILMNLSQIMKIMNRSNSNIEGKVMNHNLCLDFKKWLGNKATKVIGVTKYHHFKFSKKKKKVILEVKKSIEDTFRQIPLNYECSISNFTDIPRCKIHELRSDIKQGIESIKKYHPYKNWTLESV